MRKWSVLSGRVLFFHFSLLNPQLSSSTPASGCMRTRGGHQTCELDGHIRFSDSLPRVVILEYEVHGKRYDNRLISVVTIENRKIVLWRDYMDSLAAWTALNGS
jgi:hypothetical protein